MNPALIGGILSAIPGLAGLFGGGPQLPSYNAQDFQKLFSQLYSQLLNSPAGLGQMNNANLAGAQFSNNLGANLGSTGMNTTGIGQIQGAGAQSYTSLARSDVMAKIAEMARSQANTLMQGQSRTGEFNWQNPSGWRQLAGNIGASAWPLALGGKKNGSTGNDNNWNNVPGAGPNSPWGNF